MKHVVILGRGASGKTTLAIRLDEMTGLPVVELDEAFWQPGLVATPHDAWRAVHERLVTGDAWITDIEGALATRPQPATTIDELFQQRVRREE